MNPTRGIVTSARVGLQVIAVAAVRESKSRRLIRSRFPNTVARSFG
jgi:hypothetical protein